jgi:hypothetical protein
LSRLFPLIAKLAHGPIASHRAKIMVDAGDSTAVAFVAPLINP